MFEPTWVFAGLVGAVVLTGCGAHSGESTNPPEGVAAADCTTQIRLDGVIYSSHTYTDQEATKLGTADLADCHDTGPDAQGSVFPDNPQQVAVWSFDGYSPNEVVGVRFGEDSVAVFVADSVQPQRASRIFDELSKPD